MRSSAQWLQVAGSQKMALWLVPGSWALDGVGNRVRSVSQVVTGVELTLDFLQVLLIDVIVMVWGNLIVGLFHLIVWLG